MGLDSSYVYHHLDALICINDNLLNAEEIHCKANDHYHVRIKRYFMQHVPVALMGNILT